MSSSKGTSAAIVLAAGKGVRMQSDLPKVLHTLRGKPMIQHVVESLKKAGIERIVAVIGYRGEEVRDILDDSVETVWQREQLGTGHAVMQCEELFSNHYGNLIIACGDVPLIRPETFLDLERTLDERTRAAVLTMEPQSPTGYGRIVTDPEGEFLRIVEEKDASDEERQIREVNTGTYSFDAPLLFEGLGKVTTDNAQGEYYLPDALDNVLRAGYRVGRTKLDNALEGSGVNNSVELEKLEEYMVTI
jgi:bifunctional UDP-N-acetylglucosamine pyrophosphorylase/glucosamine-1-phosphate N-acetyltransferase